MCPWIYGAICLACQALLEEGGGGARARDTTNLICTVQYSTHVDSYFIHSGRTGKFSTFWALGLVRQVHKNYIDYILFFSPKKPEVYI